MQYSVRCVGATQAMRISVLLLFTLLFFFFFLSDAAPAPPDAGAPCADAADTAVAAPAVACAPAAAATGSGFASCSGFSDPAMANVIALLKISNLPKMAEDRVRYLIVVVSLVTLSVKLRVEGRDLIR